MLKKCLHNTILCAIIYFASGKPEDRDVAQMVERYIRDVEAARSNRVIPTLAETAEKCGFRIFFCSLKSGVLGVFSVKCLTLSNV